jgi:hypothetical protein
MERPKGKLQEFDVGNLVLLRSPRTESIGKFEAKWTGPYVITEKTRSGAYRLSDPKVEFWSTSGTQKTFIIFSFKSKL